MVPLVSKYIYNERRGKKKVSQYFIKTVHTDKI